jgi:hypothetical protein
MRSSREVDAERTIVRLCIADYRRGGDRASESKPERHVCN